MFKSLLVTLALVSAVPAFANETETSTNANSTDSLVQDADFQIRLGRNGIGLGWRPGRRPHWGRPGRAPMVECRAENGRGISFYGRAWDDDRAAHEALQECRYSRKTFNPRTCHVVDCDWVR